jgi:hypothetical protein
VTPKEAEVYIDGYMVGTVDEFDGTFQRLRLAPGEHELTLYHDGFKTVHQSLRLSQGSTFKVSYKMEAARCWRSGGAASHASSSATG